MGWDGVDWIRLVKDRPVEESFEHDNELLGSIQAGHFLSS
jgi:hypothetical protein